MVKIEWTENLAKSEPHGNIRVGFCREGRQYIKKITNFIIWAEENTGHDNSSYFNWEMKQYRHDYIIEISFTCLTTYHLKKIHNKFRTLVSRLYGNHNKD